jgi:hypothetical protein
LGGSEIFAGRITPLPNNRHPGDDFGVGRIPLEHTQYAWREKALVAKKTSTEPNNGPTATLLRHRRPVRR